jgi:hypothetical protein
MRFMAIVKATEDSEKGVMPSQAMLEAMGAYNEELVKAGVMLAGEGLQPSSKGARIRYGGERPTVTDGPFAEAKELIAGFAILEVDSLAEAVEHARKFALLVGSERVDVRRVVEFEDLQQDPE